MLLHTRLLILSSTSIKSAGSSFLHFWTILTYFGISLGSCIESHGMQ